MSVEEESKKLLFEEKFDVMVEEAKISPERLGELVELARRATESKDELDKILDEETLSPTEQSLLAFLGQMEGEINERLEEGTLSAEDAERLRKKFGFAGEDE